LNGFNDNEAYQKMRKNLDVIVTENMFGDILTDEAAQVARISRMLAAAASLGEKTMLYTNQHGSAPL